MSLTIPARWLGRGRHRAADQIVLLEERLALVEADRDRWRALAETRQATIGHADELITRVCRNAAVSRDQVDELRGERDILAEANELLLNELDVLAARFTAQGAELANLRAISSPAPADHGPAIPLHDPERTIPTPVYAAWDAPGCPLRWTAA